MIFICFKCDCWHHWRRYTGTVFCRNSSHRRADRSIGRSDPELRFFCCDNRVVFRRHYRCRRNDVRAFGQCGSRTVSSVPLKPQWKTKCGNYCNPVWTGRILGCYNRSHRDYILKVEQTYDRKWICNCQPQENA